LFIHLFIYLFGVSFYLFPVLRMDVYAAEAVNVKDHVVCDFDAQSVDFWVWMEKLGLHLMANGLFSGLLDDEDQGDKKILASAVWHVMQ
jgi:hypothetical protein